MPEGEDCISPSRHAEFHDVVSLVDWVEMLAERNRPPGRDQVRGWGPRISGVSWPTS
ncbi:MAG: hypothetical protein WKF76_04150 [Nocardioidaceae bacterium]